MTPAGTGVASKKSKFAEENLKSGGILLFGRITYEFAGRVMVTPTAMRDNPIVAEGMNNAEKFVFSRTLKKAGWNNTRVLRNNIIEEIKKMKQTPGKDMAILGSGSILTQFAEQGIIDEYQIMVDPVVISDGTPIFKDLKHKLDLKLTSTRTFNSGVVLLCYQPAQKG